MRCLVAAALALAACSSPPQHPSQKRPNTELIEGDFERHPPDGETAVRFGSDGSFRLAKNRMQFDVEPAPAVGTYKLDGDQLTFTNGKGACTETKGDRAGVYKVVVSKIGIHFTKVNDSCERRRTLDGQTWWRVR